MNAMEYQCLPNALAIPFAERANPDSLPYSRIEREKPEIQQAWMTEVQQRMNSVRAGTTKLLDFDELYGPTHKTNPI